MVDETSLFPTEAANQYYDPVTDVLRAYYACLSDNMVPPASLHEWAQLAWKALQAHCHEEVSTQATYLITLQRALLVQLACHWRIPLPDNAQSYTQKLLHEKLLVPLLHENAAHTSNAPRLTAPLRIA